MKKISTLFEVKYVEADKGKKLITPNVASANAWVYTEAGVIATRKWDGAAAAIIDGQLYRRYDAKHGKTPPVGAIPCQDPDLITGHWPHWLKCERGNNQDRYFFEAFDRGGTTLDGSYELCGPKVSGNPEKFETHCLIAHGRHVIDLPDFSFETIKLALEALDIEGIVFHGRDGKMCKVKKSNFGIRR